MHSSQTFTVYLISSVAMKKKHINNFYEHRCTEGDVNNLLSLLILSSDCREAESEAAVGRDLTGFNLQPVP